MTSLNQAWAFSSKAIISISVESLICYLIQIQIYMVASATIFLQMSKYLLKVSLPASIISSILCFLLNS